MTLEKFKERVIRDLIQSHYAWLDQTGEEAQTTAAEVRQVRASSCLRQIKAICPGVYKALVAKITYKRRGYTEAA